MKPDERTGTLRQARDFLLALSDGERLAGVLEVKSEARRLLHYPDTETLDVLARHAPEWLSAVEDSLTPREVSKEEGMYALSDEEVTRRLRRRRR